jgi:hypothetical protein
VGFRVDLDAVEKIKMLHCRKSNPGHPARGTSPVYLQENNNMRASTRDQSEDVNLVRNSSVIRITLLLDIQQATIFYQATIGFVSNVTFLGQMRCVKLQYVRCIGTGFSVPFLLLTIYIHLPFHAKYIPAKNTMRNSISQMDKASQKTVLTGL